MIEILANDNTQVLPGDVLLLRSKGPFAVLNRFAQRVLRPGRPLRRARFTHVALVISRTHLADAIPKTGVRMRRWKDAAGAYDLDRCVVVRHPALASDPKKQEDLLLRVQYYYSQRYRVTALATRNVKHNRGLVCSQFVALVLHDLGLPPVVRAPMQGLPSDIDHNTRSRNGWLQFPLSEYGLYADACAAPAGQPASDTSGTEVDTALDTWAADIAMKFSDAAGERMAVSMQRVEEFSRVTAELDRTVLKSINKLRALPDGLVPEDDGSPLDLSADLFSASSLLKTWKTLYLTSGEVKVGVLANEDAPQRLAEHRYLFGKTMADVVALVKTAVSEVKDYLASADRVRELIEKGCVLDPAFVSSLYELGLMIAEPMKWLQGESRESILARCEHYTEVAKDLQSVQMDLGEEFTKLAQDQLMAFFDLEGECLTWVTTAGPVVLELTDMFSSLLPFSAQAYSGDPVNPAAPPDTD